jgi:hypothetical protein
MHTKFLSTFWRNRIMPVIMSPMSKLQCIILLGLWVIIFPFLGFPFFWDRVIAVATGLLIVGCVYSLRKKNPSSTSSVEQVQDVHAPYVEHRTKPTVTSGSRMITSDPTTPG